MCDGATAGFKYFQFDGNENPSLISVTLQTGGNATGKLQISTAQNAAPLAEIEISPTPTPQTPSAPITFPGGKQAIFLTYTGEGFIDFYNFKIS
jgi:hypothetical protein